MELTSYSSSFVNSSDTTITVTTPAHAAGNVLVTVTTPGGVSTEVVNFNYQTPAPTITSLSPSSGSTAGGYTVTITGTNLTGATNVDFGGVAGTNLTVNDDTSITVTTPAHAAENALVTVTTPGGTSTDAINFVYQTPPQVASTSPTDGASVDASSPIAVTFTTAMNPLTLTGQTSAGTCTGSIQVSLDDFASCIAFPSGLAVMSDNNMVATLTPQPGLLVNRTYKIRVTTAATAENTLALPSDFTQTNAFGTTSPIYHNPSIVISQIYGGGGNAGALYKNDYVELFNSSDTAVNLTGMSLQYASATGSGWSTQNLSGSIPAGGYFLIQLAGGATGATLPVANLTGTINLATASGKIALMNTTNLNSASCPAAASVLDFIGYGSANCYEGQPTTALLVTTAAIRVQNGCGDSNNNNSDFTVGVLNPRNSNTRGVSCGPVSNNESGSDQEVGFCKIQFPMTLSVQTGTSTGDIFGYVEAGVTGGVGNANVRAQLGYGLASSNPQYQAGWTWINATNNIFNMNDYFASFTAPAPGTYAYVYRFSLDNGKSWTVCSTNGAGSNSGLTFDFADEGVLTVTP